MSTRKRSRRWKRRRKRFRFTGADPIKLWRSPIPVSYTHLPYLALAVLLEAGMDGIRNQIMPPESVDLNIFEMSEEERQALGLEKLPMTLAEAVDELEKDELICKVLGEDLSTKLIESYREKYREYQQQITQWEIDQYLHKM